jgi:hypothetical protein
LVQGRTLADDDLLAGPAGVVHPEGRDHRRQPPLVQNDTFSLVVGVGDQLGPVIEFARTHVDDGSFDEHIRVEVFGPEVV